jgi:hypothetical protein
VGFGNRAGEVTADKLCPPSGFCENMRLDVGRGLDEVPAPMARLVQADSWGKAQAGELPHG